MPESGGGSENLKALRGENRGSLYCLPPRVVRFLCCRSPSLLLLQDTVGLGGWSLRFPPLSPRPVYHFQLTGGWGGVGSLARARSSSRLSNRSARGAGPIPEAAAAAKVCARLRFTRPLPRRAGSGRAVPLRAGSLTGAARRPPPQRHLGPRQPRDRRA